MESKPSNAGPMTIYNDAANGNCYVSNYLGGTGWNSWDLDSIACQDLQDLLTDDWFAIGISGFYSASAYYLLYQCGPGYIDVKEPAAIEEEITQYPVSIFAVQNYPNPFSTSTHIIITLSSIGHSAKGVELNIYDMSGRLVKSFPISNLQFPISKVVWEGRDNSGKRIPTGTYFYRLTVGNKSITKSVSFIQ
jgi:hypothetical protein